QLILHAQPTPQGKEEGDEGARGRSSSTTWRFCAPQSKQGDKNRENQDKAIQEMEKKNAGHRAPDQRAGELVRTAAHLEDRQLRGETGGGQERQEVHHLQPPFLTNRHGYKLAMSACLYGDGKSRGKYMSLFVCICKGDNDPLLAWPFAYKITFHLIDQCEDVAARRNIVYVVKPNTCKENRPFLGRPVGERNASFRGGSIRRTGSDRHSGLHQRRHHRLA
uniref:MATH domain-containing protein n=1 Tax=Macrostomum lignano TaxID=282301 RepID=A0A1I8F7W7_9PLAT